MKPRTTRTDCAFLSFVFLIAAVLATAASYAYEPRAKPLTPDPALTAWVSAASYQVEAEHWRGVAQYLCDELDRPHVPAVSSSSSSSVSNPKAANGSKRSAANASSSKPTEQDG